MTYQREQEGGECMKFIMQLLKEGCAERFELEFDDLDGTLDKRYEMTLIGPIRVTEPAIKRQKIGLIHKKDVLRLAKAT